MYICISVYAYVYVYVSVYVYTRLMHKALPNPKLNLKPQHPQPQTPPRVKTLNPKPQPLHTPKP